MSRYHRSAMMAMRARACLLLAAWSVTPAAAAPQSSFTVEELAQYRLTLAVFERFEAASRRIAEVTERHPRLADDPLFTREVSVLDEAAAAAAALEKRLTGEPLFFAALEDAKLSAREYTRFALALFAARLAHGFLRSGAMRRVPPGITSDNVAFVTAHDARIGALLARLGLEP